jgi:hypothetical protein
MSSAAVIRGGGGRTVVVSALERAVIVGGAVAEGAKPKTGPDDEMNSQRNEDMRTKTRTRPSGIQLRPRSGKQVPIHSREFPRR